MKNSRKNCFAKENGERIFPNISNCSPNHMIIHYVRGIRTDYFASPRAYKYIDGSLGQERNA